MGDVTIAVKDRKYKPILGAWTSRKARRDLYRATLFSIFALSLEGPPRLVAFYDEQGVLHKDLL
jgi:hypothetical protein